MHSKYISLIGNASIYYIFMATVIIIHMEDRDMKNKFGIKEVVAIGIGTALFVALTEVQIPLGFIPNTALQPRAALLAFLAAVFGPIVGGVVGLLGHALGDALFYGSIWWSWVFPEAVFGVAVGLFAKKFAIKDGGFDAKNIVLFNQFTVFQHITEV